MKSKLKSIGTCIVLFSVLIFNTVNAQVSENSELYKIINSKDRQMFELGFNRCDMEQIEKVLPEKFEFYHDRDGMITSRDLFIATLNKNLCSSGKNTTQRTLDEGSVEVFALYDGGRLYGAIHTGTHHFGNTSAKFTNTWINHNGQWAPERILSYEHKREEPAKITDISFITLSSDEMKNYIGKYEFSPEFTLTILIDGNKLYGEAEGQKVQIRPYGEHRFLDQNQRMKLNFIVSNTGIIEGLTMFGLNGKMNARKKN